MQSASQRSHSSREQTWLILKTKMNWVLFSRKKIPNAILSVATEYVKRNQCIACDCCGKAHLCMLSFLVGVLSDFHYFGNCPSESKSVLISI